MVELYDLSNHNKVTPDLTDDNIAGVFHKATQGDWFTDRLYHGRKVAVGLLGKVWGAYLFPEPTSKVKDQLDHFDAVAKIQPGDVIALDFEDYVDENKVSVWSRYSKATIARMGTDLMNGLQERHPNNRVLLYCNYSTYIGYVVQFGIPVGDGLWLAWYNIGVPPIDSWLFHQYTSNPLDRNRTKFTNEHSLQEWAGMEGDMAPTAQDIVKAFMEYRIEGVHVASVAGEGEEQEVWSTTVENLLGSMWGQMFNATGEYGPSLAGGLENLTDAVARMELMVGGEGGPSGELIQAVRAVAGAVQRVADKYAPLAPGQGQ